MTKEDGDYCVFVIFIFAFRFHQSRCLDRGLVFMFNAWMVEVRPFPCSHSPLLSSPFFLSSSWSGHREAKISSFLCHRWIAVIYLFIFRLFPKYLSSPRAIWALLIWTLKEQRVSWPPLLTGKQRAWPKIHPLLSWIPPYPQTNVGRMRPSKSNLFLVGPCDGFRGISTRSTNTQCGSGNDPSYTDEIHTHKCAIKYPR